MFARAVVVACSVACVSSVALAGSVKGTVLFEGEPPTQPVLKRDSDLKCSQNRADEQIVVAKGKLRDVVVRVKNGTAKQPAAAPTTQVVIDQEDCMYSPRVVAIVAGQPVVVHNSDNTFHNVHGSLFGAAKDLFNTPQGPGAENVAVDASAAKPGDVVQLQCDVHPWMRSYIAVNDTPYFAVTGADGTFDIEGLPEGTYTLEAWHPTLGVRTLKIVIGKAKRGDVTARFSYKASEM
ncbi:MAG TPA: carboxypeptidase regulatory-like domain-containing protein [Kofleriaceae bacterium]|jgi:plastocyanin